MPTTVKVTASKLKGEKLDPKEKISASVEYNFGDNLKEAVALFGEDVVFSNYLSRATVSAQNVMRPKVEDGDSQETIAAFMNKWKLGTAVARTTTVNADSVAAHIASLPKGSPERAAYEKTIMDAIKGRN